MTKGIIRPGDRFELEGVVYRFVVDRFDDTYGCIRESDGEKVIINDDDVADYGTWIDL